jgi:predicted DsbA family dithiol-disulfide isomerase
VRLQRVASEFAGRVRLEWRPFALRPAPSGGRFQFAGSYVEAAWRRAAALSAEDGITYRMWDGEPFPRWSMPALEAGMAAQRQGPKPFGRFHLEVFRAFFERSCDISDPAVMIQVAQTCGLDVARFEADLASEVMRAATMEAFDAAMNDSYVSAVPTVLIGRQRFVGLSPLAEYRGAIEEQLAGETE